MSDGVNLYSIGGRNNGDASTNVYKSTDNGVIWSLVATAVWTPNLQFSNVACFFNSKIRVLHKNTVTGKWEAWSSANGATWAMDSADIGPGVTSIAAFSYITDGSTLWAFFSLASAGTGQLWKSTDGTTFSSVTTSPGWSGRDGAVAAVLDNRLYVMAGMNISSVLLNDVWVSTTAGVTWVQLLAAAPWSPRIYPAAWSLDGRIWIAGGGTNAVGSTRVNDIYSSENGSAWLLASASASWSARFRMSYTVHNNALYMGPGTTDTAIVGGLFHAAPTVSTLIPLVPPPATSCLPFQLTLIPATPSTPVAVFLKNNEVAYYYNGLTVVQITDPDYPTSTVFGVVYLDGYIFVMNAIGQIFNSNLSNPTSWSALDFISANAEADAAVALVRQLNYVVALKEYSIEFFYDAGNATGSPLSKVLNALLEIGCAGAGSIAFADNTFYFMANARQKGRSIMKMEGYTPKYISNPYVDRILNGDDLAGVYAFVVKTNGHFFYVLTLTTSAITIVYDEVTSEWHTWSHMTEVEPDGTFTLVAQADGSILVTSTSAHGQADGNVVTISGASVSAANGQFNLRYNATSHSASQFSYVPDTVVTGAITGTIVVTFYSETYFPGVYYAKGGGEDLLLDQVTGDVYQFDPDIYQDNSLPINLRIRTALLDFGVMATKRYSRLELVGDKVTANVLVRFSDDDYETWSLYRIIPMAQKRAKISNLGSARRRAFEFRHTGNTALRLLAAEIDVDIGAF